MAVWDGRNAPPALWVHEAERVLDVQQPEHLLADRLEALERLFAGPVPADTGRHVVSVHPRVERVPEEEDTVAGVHMVRPGVVDQRHAHGDVGLEVELRLQRLQRRTALSLQLCLVLGVAGDRRRVTPWLGAVHQLVPREPRAVRVLRYRIRGCSQLTHMNALSLLLVVMREVHLPVSTGEVNGGPAERPHRVVVLGQVLRLDEVVVVHRSQLVEGRGVVFRVLCPFLRGREEVLVRGRLDLLSRGAPEAAHARTDGAHHSLHGGGLRHPLREAIDDQPVVLIDARLDAHRVQGRASEEDALVPVDHSELLPEAAGAGLQACRDHQLAERRALRVDAPDVAAEVDRAVDPTERSALDGSEPVSLDL